MVVTVKFTNKWQTDMLDFNHFIFIVNNLRLIINC
jgi:hypothetical protein